MKRSIFFEGSWLVQQQNFCIVSIKLALVAFHHLTPLKFYGYELNINIYNKNIFNNTALKAPMSVNTGEKINVELNLKLQLQLQVKLTH